MRKFTLGFNELESTHRNSDYVSGTELQLHYTPYWLFLQVFVALPGRLQLSPLGCPFRQKGQSCQGCIAPNSALSLTGTVFLPFL